MKEQSWRLAPATSRPDLTVVLVTAGQFRNLRRTVRHLRAQTARERLEVVIVAPSLDALADRGPDELDGFFGVTLVPAGTIGNVDKSAAHGVRRAGAPVIALLEDHAYPEPGWAEALIEAHQGPWAAVGPTVLNANPESLLSWTNLLMAYGRWSDPVPRGEADLIARHNVSFRREVLAEYGDALEKVLGREGGLLQDLRAKGHRFFVEPAARVEHANPSLLTSTVELRFHAGRLYGALRARAGRWSAAKRLLYILGGPLIPLVRFWRFRRELFAGGRNHGLFPRVFPHLLFGLILDGLGQMVGYALGPGNTVERLAVFESDRLRQLTVQDRQKLAA